MQSVMHNGKFYNHNNIPKYLKIIIVIEYLIVVQQPNKAHISKYPGNLIIKKINRFSIQNVNIKN